MNYRLNKAIIYFKSPFSLILILTFIGCNSFFSDDIVSDDIIKIEQAKVIESLNNHLVTSKDNLAKLIYCDSILLSPLNNSELFEAKIKFFRATATTNTIDNSSLFKLYTEIELVFRKEKDFLFLTRTLLKQSIFNSTSGNFAEANINVLEAIQLAKKLNNASLITNSKNVLSYIEFKNKNYLKALEYLNETKLLHEKENDSISLSGVLNNIAVLYKNIGQFSKAMDYYLKSLEIDQSLKNKNGIAKAYNNIGNLFKTEGNFTKAESHYLKAIKINSEINSLNSSPIQNLGELQFSQKRYNEAEITYQKALEIELNHQKLEEQISISTALLNTGIKLKNFNKVNHYAEKINQLQEKKEDLIRLESSKMFEQQNRFFENRLELKRAKVLAEFTKLILFILLGLFLFVILFIIQRFKSMTLKSERNKVRLELQVLRSQLNPHFIFNALSAIQLSVMENNPIRSAGYISRFAKLIRQNFEFVSKSKITLKEDLDALENYLKTQQMRYENKFEYDIEIDETVNTDETKIPPMLLQPFAENAIEHGFKNEKKGGKINIKISKNKNFLTFLIKDNGIGYYPKEKSKLHAIKVMKKRLELLNKGDEKSFEIKNNSIENGTIVKFSLYYSL